MTHQLPDHMQNLDSMIWRAQAMQSRRGYQSDMEIWAWIEFIGKKMREVERRDDG